MTPNEDRLSPPNEYDRASVGSRWEGACRN
jgi:hypothetical protein